MTKAPTQRPVWQGSPGLRKLLVPIGLLAPHPDNPRRHDVATIKASLEALGQQKPIVIVPAGRVNPDLHTREWRDLPRDGDCAAEFLFSEKVAGPCRGLMHRHHVIPGDPTSRTYLACARHHPTIEAFLRRLRRGTGWRPCPHRPGVHRYPGAREACEASLNRHLERVAA